MLIGGGEMVAAFADRPEVREVVRFLLSPDFGAEMAEPATGLLLAEPPVRSRQLHALRAAPGRGSSTPPSRPTRIRFDASDLMPPEIGADRFFDAMMTYLAEGPDSLDRILTELDAAWPDDTS